MCNAWNHPIDCTCGWGGEGHLGKRTDGDSITNQIRLFTNWNPQSYTIPNAKCPVCGVPVFFYKSENGGSVFFDELGPPWPKHPCTDNTNYYTPSEYNFSQSNPQREWEKNNWIPVIAENSVKNSSSTIVITRINKSSDNNIEVLVNDSDAEKLTMKDTLIFFKRNSSQTFTLIAFDIIKYQEVQLIFTCDTSELDKFCDNDPFQSMIEILRQNF